MKHLFLCLALLVMGATAGHSQERAEVLLETTAGNIRLALYNETPQHRDNFLKIVREHVLDSLLFHRVIKNFMIQGGDPDSRQAAAGELLGNGNLGYTIEPEFRLPTLFHKRGALAAARESDDVNPEMRSSSCQFYIVWGSMWNDAALDRLQARLDTTTNGRVQLTPEMREAYMRYGGTPHLDGQYTVFGEVTEGMDVVDEIQYVPTDKNARPTTDVRIVRATIVREP